MKLTTTIDVALGRGQNMREHYKTTARRKDKEKKATRAALYSACGDMERPEIPSLASCEQRGARVTVVRPYSPSAGPMDSDNLSGSFKYPRDEIAAFLGVDDGSPRLHFIYQQTVATKLGMSVKKGRTKASPDYDTRPTVTIEVMPVQDIDPQVKRVRELEDKLRRVEDKLSHVRSVTSKRGSDYEMRIAELEECLRRWENFAYVNETKGQELGPIVSSIVAETRALLAKCVAVDLEALLTSKGGET